MRDLRQAGVARVVIERPHKKCRVTIHSARPGVIIGKKGADIEKLKTKIAKMTSSEVVVNIVEVRKPEVDAQLVAESIAQQLERRVGFRRAMKRAVQSAMRLVRSVFVSIAAAVWVAQRLRAPNGIVRGVCRYIHCAPISTMAWPKP